MRQILFEIWLSQPWSGWTTQPQGPERLGAGWVLLAVFLVHLAYQSLRGNLQQSLKWPHLWPWGLAVAAMTILGPVGPLQSFPLFGYGMMVLLGFVVAIGFTQYRAKQIGFDPEIVLDLAFWILLTGITGGRLAHLVQYHREVFSEARTLPEALFAAVNLTNGGLVLIGALAGGTLGLFAFCRTRKLNPLMLADLVMPAVFIGIGFGRIGCLLNGCCFGDRCELPWGIRFPQGSTTFNVLALRGFVAPDASETIPLHPTQIYSSLDGFILAFVTGQFFWLRRHHGDVFALGCVLYSINRILTEFVRADEMGQFGTGFTISQWYSALILLAGLALWGMNAVRTNPANGQPVSLQSGRASAG